MTEEEFEAKLEEAEQKAYEEGFECGKCDAETGRYEKGYDAGYEDGWSECLKEHGNDYEYEGQSYEDIVSDTADSFLGRLMERLEYRWTMSVKPLTEEQFSYLKEIIEDVNYEVSK